MICRKLDWDSSFFGLRIARVSATRLTPADAESALGWCREQQIDCLYFLADPSDPDTITAAEHADFHAVDIRVTYERELAPHAFTHPPRIRPARREDVPWLEAIAAESHRDTRFYFDRRFPPESASELYRTWIRQSCARPEGTVLVWEAEADGEPVGYVACDHVAGQPGQIGLLGLQAQARGRGGGTTLVQSALAWFAGRGATSATVVTQGRNVGAQRLYQKAGFLIQRVEIWYHRWFER